MIDSLFNSAYLFSALAFSISCSRAAFVWQQSVNKPTQMNYD